MCTELEGVGVSGHVWHRKELESYLLDSEVIARVAVESHESWDAITQKVVYQPTEGGDVLDDSGVNGRSQ